MSRKILVTGNAGFIGSNLTKKLLALDYEVIGIDNFNNYYDPKRKEKNIAEFNSNPNFSQERGDILDKEKLELIFSHNRPKAVIHLAARAGVRPSLLNPELYWQVNVQGTKNLLDQARKYSVKQFILASSSSVYGNQTRIPFSESDKLTQPISPYAQTKLKAETLCKQYNFPVTVLRFFTVYGPKGRPDMAPYLFTKRILGDQAITRFGDGSTSRDYTYVDDIVDGIIAVMNKPMTYEIINLGNNQPVTLNKFITLIEELTGKKAKIIEKPRHPADVPQTFANISKAKKLLNWQPKTDLKTGLTKFIEWFKLSQSIDHP